MASQTSCVLRIHAHRGNDAVQDGGPFSDARRWRFARGLRRGLKFQRLERNFHREIPRMVELAHRRLRHIIKREIGVARFIGREMPEIHLAIDVGPIGNFLAIAIFADRRFP